MTKGEGPQIWPEKALVALDSLCVLNERMNYVKSVLHYHLGFRPTTEEVRAMANRFQEAPVVRPPKERKAPYAPKAPAAKAISPGPSSRLIAAPRAIEVAFVPRSGENRRREVTPGTYPARSFSMLGGRIR